MNLTPRQQIIQTLLSFLKENYDLTGYLLINDGKDLNTWYTKETDLQKLNAAIYEHFGYRNKTHGKMFIKTLVTNRTNQICYFSGYR